MPLCCCWLHAGAALLRIKEHGHARPCLPHTAVQLLPRGRLHLDSGRGPGLLAGRVRLLSSSHAHAHVSCHTLGQCYAGCGLDACLSVHLHHRCRRLGELQPGPPGAAAAVKAVDITVLGFALRWGGGLICARRLIAAACVVCCRVAALVQGLVQGRCAAVSSALIITRPHAHRSACCTTPVQHLPPLRLLWRGDVRPRHLQQLPGKRMASWSRHLCAQHGEVQSLVWSSPTACSLPASPNRHQRRFRMLRPNRLTLSAAGHPVPGHLHATDCARKHAHRAGVGGPRLRWVTVERQGTKCMTCSGICA